MKLRTHLRIAETAADLSGVKGFEKALFCFGSMFPDLSPMQFVHKHFYQKSGQYVLKKFDALKWKNTVWTAFQLGELAHYVSDFCCYVHQSGSIGNVKEHIRYERKLNQYTINNTFDVANICNRMPLKNDLNSILNAYKENQNHGYSKDLYFSVIACSIICKQIRQIADRKAFFFQIKQGELYR